MAVKNNVWDAAANLMNACADYVKAQTGLAKEREQKIQEMTKDLTEKLTAANPGATVRAIPVNPENFADLGKLFKK